MKGRDVAYSETWEKAGIAETHRMRTIMRHDELERSGGEGLTDSVTMLRTLGFAGRARKNFKQGINIIRLKFHKDHSGCNVENRLEGKESTFGRSATVLVRDASVLTRIVTMKMKRILRT